MRQYFEIVNEMVAGLFLPFKSKLLTFNEVGLSITIPKGLRVKSDEQVRKKASNRPSEPEAFYQVFFTGNEECFPLFFAANAERSFMSGVMFRLGQRSKDVAEKDYHEYLDSFWDSIEKEDNFFSRVYLERKSENITVSNVMVEKNGIILKNSW
ncbi:MAG: hypothetical protein JST13_11280 [Bacteroidetes bacterium]|nr:hypothetical protein [Bacteroidota bacterium]